MIRVFHLIKSLGRGGAETLLVQGLDCADRESFEFAYGYFLPWKDQLVPDLRERGATVREFTARTPAGCLAQAVPVARFLRRWKADVVHSHLPVASITARLAAKLAGVPLVATEHNLLQRYHRATRLATLATWRLQDRVIAVSREVEESIHQHAGRIVPTEVVLNGVAVHAFRRDEAGAARVRREWEIPSDAPIVGTVAVFRVQKRLGDWLGAARKILDHHPTTHFLLVGDGPERSEVERVSAELGLNGRVHLCGLQSDVRPYLSAMDVYLMSSVFEGLPIAMLEAMSIGLPIVATTVGGIPEVVRTDVEGYLADPGEVDQLSRFVSKILEDRSLRVRLGNAAHARVENDFGMARMQARLEAIYREVVSA